MLESLFILLPDEFLVLSFYKYFSLLDDYALLILLFEVFLLLLVEWFDKAFDN